MVTLYPILWDASEPGHILFVAFDRATAQSFAKRVNDAYDCEVTTVGEVALIDRYGFPCERKDAALCAPWLADVHPATLARARPEPEASPDFKFIASTFGGGWLIPLNDEVTETYTRAFDDKPAALAPIGGQVGWIVEPQDMRDLFADIRADGYTVLQVVA